MSFQTPYRYLLAALFTGIVIDFFFLFHTPGISLPIFVILLISLFEVIRSSRIGRLSFSRYHLLLIPAVYFSFIPALRADGFVLFLSTVSLIVLLGMYFALACHPMFFKRFSGLEAIELAVKEIIAPITQLGKVIQFLLHPTINGGGKSTNRLLFKIVIGLSITVPLFLIVLALLSQADEIFKDVIGDISKLLPEVSFESLATFVLALSLGGGLWFYLLGQIESKVLDKSQFKIGLLDKISVDTIVPAILMYSLSFLYIVFVVIQFGYLFGGEDFTHEHNVVFSEYAINGFWEMITVTLLNFAILYFIQTRFSLKKSSAKMVLLPGIFVIIFSSVVMLISSHSRLQVYENGYGFTKDRLVPHVFLILEVAIFTLLTVNVFVKDKLRRKVLNIGTFAAVVLFIMGLGAFNMESFIVRKNIEKYHNRDANSTLLLDMNYLSHDLGLEGARELMGYSSSKELRDYFNDLEDLDEAAQYDVLCDEECMHQGIISEMVDAKQTWGVDGWKSWNWQYVDAKRLFEEQYTRLDLLKNLDIEGYEFHRYITGFHDYAGGNYQEAEFTKIDPDGSYDDTIDVRIYYFVSEELAEKKFNDSVGYGAKECESELAPEKRSSEDKFVCDVQEHGPDAFKHGNFFVRIYDHDYTKTDKELFEEVYKSFVYEVN